MESEPVAKPETEEERVKRRRAERSAAFMNALTGVTAGVRGIVRRRRRGVDGEKGELHMAYWHQLLAVRRAVEKGRSRLVLVHDAGTGKTFTALCSFGALYIFEGGRRLKMLVLCPASCITQWAEEVEDTLRGQRVLAVRRMGHLTAEALEESDVVVLSHDMARSAYTSCYQRERRQNEFGSWVNAWVPIPGAPLHPLLRCKFDFAVVDEVHSYRNAKATWTVAAAAILRNVPSAVGLTATPLMNCVKNMAGLATALHIPSYSDPAVWFADKACKRVNLATFESFSSAYVDRVFDSVLGLPPISHTTVEFDAELDASCVSSYNAELGAARRVVGCAGGMRAIQRGDTGGAGRSAQQLAALMGHLQKLQQHLVSPLVARHGADAFKRNPALYEQSAAHATGCKRRLRAALLELRAAGHERVIVACMHVTLMRDVCAFLALGDAGCAEESARVGETVVYEGSLSHNKRSAMVHNFLHGGKSVLFLSVSAGGTGLHLVPGCSAMVFWGSRPFSPQQVLQTSKRIHRIGQTRPVEIVHVIAKGSVDDSINRLHRDKAALARAVTDLDFGNLQASGGTWRTLGTIASNCHYLNASGSLDSEADVNGRKRAAPAPPPPPEHPPKAQRTQQTPLLHVSIADMLSATANAMASHALHAAGLQL
jgi:hypothetical protein